MENELTHEMLRRFREIYRRLDALEGKDQEQEQEQED